MGFNFQVLNAISIWAVRFPPSLSLSFKFYLSLCLTFSNIVKY
ncbi:hypothetical protein NC653_031692 [Populus alba x Populus x berolinensis]|uniref:Uncharacterized protein n=1 Tax=Populus alba x Populus x berolinensis TaxID=444605 RepID=A0AAD6M064_9ROSI|nr:hypothetical protein NC653_031692 [Populus alba x Populus x berolinensis]